MNFNRTPRKAFTLIELLVVVAIIALLVSILLPALGRARELTRSAVCLANLKRIAFGGHMYLMDYGVFPPLRIQVAPDGSPYVNQYNAAAPRWQWFVDQGTGPVIDPSQFNGQVFGDAQGLPALTMTNDYFTCPSFIEADLERHIRDGAYGYNYQYLGNSRTEAFPGRYDNWPVRELIVTHPSSTVFFGDSRGGNVPHGGHSCTLDPPKLAVSRNARRFGPSPDRHGPIAHSPISARHIGRGNASFVDGHAETMTLEKFGYELDAQGVVIPNQGSNFLWTGTGQDE